VISALSWKRGFHAQSRIEQNPNYRQYFDSAASSNSQIKGPYPRLPANEAVYPATVAGRESKKIIHQMQEKARLREEA
jgi:hypothetical protein